MSRVKNKEVRFDIYCQKCKHFKKDEFREPCNSCMEEFFNLGTDKPVNFKEDKKKSGAKQGKNE